MKYVFIIFVSMLFTVGLKAKAATVDDAKVVYAGTYGSGRLFVALNKTILEPGCNLSRFDVPAGHDQIKTWLSVAMAATASGKSVKVSTNGCLGPFPTMDNTDNTYFYIKQ